MKVARTAPYGDEFLVTEVCKRSCSGHLYNRGDTIEGIHWVSNFLSFQVHRPPP